MRTILNLNKFKNILKRTKEYRKNMKNNITKFKKENIYLKTNKESTNINKFLNNLLNDNYDISLLVKDLTRINLKNQLKIVIKLYYKKLIFLKDLEFLITLYYYLKVLYKTEFINLFNDSINLYFNKINIKQIISLDINTINCINFHILWLISLKFIDKNLKIQSLNNFLCSLINLFEEDKNNLIKYVNISWAIYNFLVPLIYIDVQNITKNNYFKLIKDKNDILFNKNDYDDSQKYFISLIDRLVLLLEININFIKKKFTDYVIILEKKFYLDFKISNSVKNKVLFYNTIILYYKDFIFINNNYFTNKSLKLTIDEEILLKKNNLLKEFNIELIKEYFENPTEFTNYSRQFDLDNKKILLKKHIDYSYNINNLIIDFNNLNCINDAENLINLINNNKNLAINNFIIFLNNINFGKNLIFQIIIINKLLWIDHGIGNLFLNWINNFLYNYGTSENITETDVNYIKLIIHLIKFGTINIILILNYIPFFLDNLSDKNLYFIFKIINNWKYFLKNFKIINKGFLVLLNNIIDAINSNIYFKKLYSNKVLKIQNEFKFKENKSLSNIIIKILDNLIIESKLDDFIFIFLKLPLNNIKDKINKLLVNYVFNNSFILIENISKLIKKLDPFYPEIKIYYLDYLFEYLIDAIDNKSFENKQDILNVCIAISYCFNYNLIDELELLKLLYIIIYFNNNLLNTVMYENFDKNNSFPLQMICIIFSKININNFLNHNNIFLFFFYLQIYILNLNYIDLNIEIQIKEIFLRFNENIIFLNSFKNAEIVLSELNKFYMNESKYIKLLDIFISKNILKEFKNLDIKNISDNNKSYDFIEIAENSFLKDLNNLIE